MQSASDEYVKMLSMGFISLEEVEDLNEDAAVEDQGVDTGSKRVASDTKKSKKTKKAKTIIDSEVEEEQQVLPEIPSDSAWREAKLPDWLIQGLLSAGLTGPTAIQQAVFKQAAALDLMIRAPTGSGKTLAYLIPILKALSAESGVMALILVPTRELACQVRDQLKLVTRHAPFHVRHACLVGGMSREKQDRQLASIPHVVIGTPGRVAEILGEEGLAVERLPFLVLDEADRLMDRASGHYATMCERLIPRLAAPSHGRQRTATTMLLSATLTAELLKKSELRSLVRPKQLGFVVPQQQEEEEEEKGEGKGKQASLAQVNPVGLRHSWIACETGRKEEQLAAILAALPAPCRAIVFVNAVESVGHQVSLLRQLGFGQRAVVGLHAHLQQRQRLQHLDRFRADPSGILVASDVAARGLDLPAVDWVIHLHVARTLPLYQHRAGRSGRAGRMGNSLVLVSPDEAKWWRTLQPAVKWQPLELLPSLKPASPWRQAVQIAQQLLQLDQTRGKRAASWEERAAEALGVDLDDEDFAGGRKQRPDSEQTANQQRQIKQLKAALKRELDLLRPLHK